ncbi:UNVERIFIED_CONTAM: putative mitochondrial protein, partial [Sesamum calycinum]
LDIAYAVSIVSQFMHDPKERHLQALYRILHYLKATPGRGILFKKGKELTLEAYTDEDYAGSVIDRRSTSSYCTFLRGAVQEGKIGLRSWSTRMKDNSKSALSMNKESISNATMNLMESSILVQDERWRHT